MGTDPTSNRVWTERTILAALGVLLVAGQCLQTWLNSRTKAQSEQNSKQIQALHNDVWMVASEPTDEPPPPKR